MKARKQGRAWRGLSLVLPAYNEEAVIAQAIAEAGEALTAMLPTFEVIVVDDGSTDGTRQVVNRLMRQHLWLRLLTHRPNRGYGAALRTGFLAARHDRVAFTDADCQFYLDDLASLLVLSETHPVVVGYRQDRKDSWQRRFYSWGYNQLVRALLGTGVRDVDCALKVFHREAVLQLLPTTRGFLVNAEMLTRARQLGLAVGEIGVRHRPRLAGESKVSIGDIPRTLRRLVPFWWNHVVLRRPMPVEDGELAGSPIPPTGSLAVRTVHAIRRSRSGEGKQPLLRW